MGERVAILDAGAQYGKVIDRRIRELSVDTVILPLNTPADQLSGYKGIVISGGPESVYDPNAPKPDPAIFNLNVPILGICYGMQLINHHFGGTVTKGTRREDGEEDIAISIGSPLFSTLDYEQRVLLTHGDSVDSIADGFTVTAMSKGIISAVEDQRRGIYGVQFHPETDLTRNGTVMLRNFLYDIAGCSGSYTIEDRVAKATAHIKATVGDDDVLVLVSGGVDSSVCATLLAKALRPEQIHAIHIDNGFMRLNESAQVDATLRAHGIDVETVDASETFYAATTTVKGKATGRLDETISPEEKRHIIGDTFMRVTRATLEARGLNPDTTYLVQGTLRPDLIESASSMASSHANTIKTHHNDTQLVREWRERGKVIEPLTEYHKDEVRALGTLLGMPDELVWRQPFPGPGLAVRILCADKPYRTADFEHVNAELGAIAKPGMSAMLLPVRTVGVQGDGRSYSYLAALSGEQNWDTLFAAAKEIPKAIHTVNRVVYVFGDPLHGPITEITPTRLTPDVIAQLQHADAIVNEELVRYDLIRSLSQVPVISFPVPFDTPGNRSIGIRTFITNDFMTGVPARPGHEMPHEALESMVTRILREVPGVSRVAYDLTSKPPGTTEWE